MKIMNRINNGDFKVYIQGNRPKNSERTEVPENINPPSWIVKNPDGKLD